MDSNIEVDYLMPLGAMIAPGCYGLVMDEINEKQVWIKGEGKKLFETRLFSPGRKMLPEEGENFVRRGSFPNNPFEPAKTEHLLAYGAKFPEEQRKTKIIAVGSIIHLYLMMPREYPLRRWCRYSPCLHTDYFGHRRILGLHLWQKLRYWENPKTDYKFLGVREVHI